MNPELRRYAWLDLGWHRILIVPLVLGALAALPMFSGAPPAKPLAWGALSIFLVLTCGWGSMRALASVVEEVRDRTWDFQRMGAFTPASLALGKVFGAPLFQWYIGAWCLVVFAIAGLAAGDPNVVVALVALVASAVMLHALGVAASAASARMMLGDRARRAGGVIMLLGLFNLLPVAALIGWDAGDANSFVRWWGWRMPRATFAAASAVLFALWALLAAWRAMARELREPARAWAWPAFAAFVALWWAGLSTPAHDRPSLALVIAAAAAVLCIGTYFGSLLEPLTRVSQARMRRAWSAAATASRPRWPAWAMNAVLALVCAVLAWSLAGRGELEVSAQLALPLALMAARDAAIVSCFALVSKVRSPVGRAVFYIALADLLLPALAMAIGSPPLARIFFPMWGLQEGAAPAAIGMALHAALALGALWLCMKSAGREPARAWESGR